MLNTENSFSRITVNPQVMVGKPTIRGLRITVEQILKALAGGISEIELLEEYPELEKEDFQAVYAYVANLISEEQVFPAANFKLRIDNSETDISELIMSDEQFSQSIERAREQMRRGTLYFSHNDVFGG